MPSPSVASDEPVMDAPSIVCPSASSGPVNVKTMLARWEQAPPAARARGHDGNRRLHHRWQVFNDRKKKPVIANVAVARELAGWCWSLAVLQ